MAENVELNRKESDELLLLNKQGQVFLTLPGEFGVPGVERFDLMLDLIEIGRVFQLFLDNFSHIRLDQEDFADYIFAQMEGWIRRPAAIFAASYTSQLAWEMIVRAFRLAEKLSLTIDSNPGLMSDIEEKRVFFAQATDHWWERPEFAAAFDSAKFRATRTLTRVRDTDLRFRIITYLREAEMSLAGRNYNAAVVMSGSAVEAMLLAVLEQDTSLNPRTLRNQGLKDYIQLARTQSKHSPLVRRVIGVGQRAAGWWWSAYQRELQTGAIARKVSWIRSTRELDSRSLLRSAVKPAWSFSL